MKNFKVVYGFNDIYNKISTNSDFFLLKKYSTKNILIKIAHINAIIFASKESNYDDQIFKKVFSSDIKKYSEFIRNLNPNINGSFFSSPHLSELIKEALNNFNDVQSDDLTLKSYFR